MQENVDYVIAQDKFGEKIIAPVDYNATGVVQSSTAWDCGLHQFLQIKHCLRITPESLTTSFISNMNFFKRYESCLTGLTGTLGSNSSQKLLEDIYNIDIAFIPTFKPQVLEEYPGMVLEEVLSHIQAIRDSAIKEAKSGRGVLIILQTIADALEITKKIKEIGYPQNKIKQYLRSDIKNSTFDGKADSGDIIVATNLAGRGTDILTSKKVEEAGGLHVIVGFLPSNLRIQDQAFGRTSRQGNKGSAELIVHNTTGANLNDLKKLRDINEDQNVSTTKTDLLEKINFEDELFQRFNYEVYQQLKTIDPNKQKLMQAEDLWGFWLSRIKKTYNINKAEGRNSIEQAFQEFKIDIFEKYGDKNCYNIMVNPAYLTNIAINKLGVNGNYSIPCDLLKQAAQLDDNFSYQAHYLGAYSSLRSGNINGTSNKAAQERVEKAGQALFHFENALHQIENVVMPQLQSAILSLGPESEGTPLAKQIDNKLRLLTTTQNNITKNIGYLRDHNDPSRSKIKVADDSLQFYNELFRGIVSQKDIEEYANFGMQHIFDVTSQKLDKDHFSGTLVAIIGIAQVIVGVVVAVGSGGFAAEFGIGLAVGGIGDVVAGMRHALKGQSVDMNQWATSKGIDLAVNLITAGISSKINAAKAVKAEKITGIKVAVKELTLHQVGYAIGKRLITTELVRFAVTGVERMAAKPIKGAQKELEFKIKQLFQEQKNKQNLREMIVIDTLNPKFHGYIPQLQRQINNLLDQKEDRFASIAQSILTQTLSSSVDSSNISTAIQIGSIGLSVGSGFSAMQELESVLVSEISSQIHQVHNTLPETTVYLENTHTLINKKEFRLMTEQLISQGIYNAHFKIDSDKLELLLATIENKSEFQGGLKEIIVTNVKKDVSTKPEEFKLQEIVQSNDNMVDSGSDFGVLTDTVNTDRFDLKCLLGTLSHLNDHLQLAANREYDGKIEQIADNVANNVGNRMRGMVASGIISPIMSPIVSNALEFVLERTGLEKALLKRLATKNEITGVSAGDTIEVGNDSSDDEGWNLTNPAWYDEDGDLLPVDQRPKEPFLPIEDGPVLIHNASMFMDTEDKDITLIQPKSSRVMFDSRGNHNPAIDRFINNVFSIFGEKYRESLQESERQKKISSLDLFESRNREINQNVLSIRKGYGNVVFKTAGEFNETFFGTIRYLFDQASHTTHVVDPGSKALVDASFGTVRRGVGELYTKLSPKNRARIENTYRDIMSHYPTENQKFGIELMGGMLIGQITANGIKMAIVKSAGGRNPGPWPFVSEINQVTGNKPLALEWVGDVKGLEKSTKLPAPYKLNKDLPRNSVQERLGGYYEYQSAENIKLQRYAEDLLLRDKSGIKNQVVDYKSVIERSTASYNPQNVNAQSAISKKISALEKAQNKAVNTMTLGDGRIRYYMKERSAKTQGITRGSAHVTEFNPKTGQVRAWSECYNHGGEVIRVHPKMIDGNQLQSQHYPLTKLEIEKWSK